ncbi:histone H1.5-like [Chiloscyllium plagiosum]|uniref:histone H1.5-like n=1 Tax=Chiloscyllium plagiosum TaxID=36176 RepID=UPI001CB86B99|nr:histone H1.5-like [Chiloscyllium plagiosum]
MSNSAATETAPPAAAPTKVKAPKKKATAPRKTAVDHQLGELILKVVGDSKDRKGTSLSAVKKALERSGIDVGKRKAQIKMSIRRCLANGSLVLVKGQGVSGSFKLPKKAAAKKPAMKISPAKKATAKKSQAKKATVKKSPAKKATTKKSPAKKARGKKTAPPKKAVSKAAPKKRTPMKKVKKTKGPKAPKPLSKPAKSKAKPKAKVTKTAAKK